MSAINLQDISSTIVPKSDQLNADQLIGSTLTITIQSVTAGNAEQPIILHYANEDGRPYKPGKTMRKVLILAWGQDATQWVGKSMTLFNDASVVFAKQEVGGIRISHLSDIKQEIKVSLNSTRGKKDLHRIAPMPRPVSPESTLRAAAANGLESFQSAWMALTKQQRLDFAALKDELKAAIESARNSTAETTE